jgi:hypothetical protein
MSDMEICRQPSVRMATLEGSMTAKGGGIQLFGWLCLIAGYGLGLVLIRGIFLGVTRGFGADPSQVFWIVLGYLLFFSLALYVVIVGRRAVSLGRGKPKPKARFGWGRMLFGAILLYGSAVDRFHLIPARSVRHLEPANRTEAISMKITAILIACGCLSLIGSGIWRGFRPRSASLPIHI